MAYRYRRRRRYGRRRNYDDFDWAEWHRNNRDAVGRKFGGIDADVTEAFFNLSPEDLNTVLTLYGERYSEKAADYARFAFPKWRSGERGMAGETLERLLEVVPYVLSFETKKELFYKVRAAYRDREAVIIKVATVEHMTLVHRTVKRIVERAEAQPLPEHVDARLVWLSEGDGFIARQLVAASEEAEGAATAEALRREMGELHRFFLNTLDTRHGMSHVVTLPCGTVTVEFTRRKKRRWFFMSDAEQPESNLPARQENRPAKDIFEFALQRMVDPEDSQEIVLAAQREHLRLAAKEREGEIDTTQAERELREFVEQMREAARSNTLDVEADASFKRASGTTHVNVKKRKRFLFW